jgi:predicted DNA-binding protein with PD1-like motif
MLEEQLELLSMIGDIALKDGQPQVHAHIVVGKSDGTAHGGHLLETRVRPPCEVVLTELRPENDGTIERKAPPRPARR